MRVNGNYFERFVFLTLPYILLGGILFILFKKTNFLIIIVPMLVMSVILFLIDKLPLRKTRFSKITIINNQLLVDGQPINAKDIEFIKPHEIVPPQTLLYFELHLKDNSQIIFMDRSKTFLYKSTNKLRSKSLDILFIEFSFLKNKLRTVGYE